MAAESAGGRTFENVAFRHVAGFSRDTPVQNARHGLAFVGRKILVGMVEQVKFKEAQTALLLSDNETTEQVAAATGAARA